MQAVWNYSKKGFLRDVTLPTEPKRYKLYILLNRVDLLTVTLWH